LDGIYFCFIKEDEKEFFSLVGSNALIRHSSVNARRIAFLILLESV
jgi:hypothetical protein